jgi:hypothetical protein
MCAHNTLARSAYVSVDVLHHYDMPSDKAYKRGVSSTDTDTRFWLEANSLQQKVAVMA